MKGKSLARRNNVAFVYMMPWLIGITVFTLYPFISSFYYALCDYNPIEGRPVFLGVENMFGNFVKLLRDDGDFYKSLKATVLYTLYTVPLKLLMSLAIAMLLCKARRGIGTLRTVYYLPSLFGGSVAIAALWKIMFHNTGMINNLLGIFGVAPISFLGEPAWALPTLSALEVWQFGSSMVMFLAALKQVPVTLYEAARIDGAGAPKRFFSITLPCISPIIFFCIIMQTINAVQNFTSAAVITQGGPLKSTYMLGLKLYDDGFRFWKMGYASATAWIIFLMIMLFTLALFASSKRWVFYGDET